MILKVSKQSGRRFLLNKQHLLPPRSLKGKEGIEHVFNTLRLVQYDPLNPCGRNADLVLQARVSDYHPDGYYDWLYRRRKGIEYYDKELCIMPVDDLPYMYYRHLRARHHGAMGPFISAHEKELEELLVRINSSGPISAADIHDKRRANIFWAEEQWGRAALESLWKLGRLTISKRHNGKKYYDLPHKVYESYEAANSMHEKLSEGHIMRRINSVGMLRKSGSGGGWQGMSPAKEVALIIHDLLKQKKLAELQMEGGSLKYVIRTEDVNDILSPPLVKKKVMVFLAPLDNLIWDREMTKELFDFDYRWEVYTPVTKRKFGYYVLPVLYGDEIVGRVEPVLQKDGTLIIKNLWKEPGIQWSARHTSAFEKAVSAFKTYLRASSVVSDAHM